MKIRNWMMTAMLGALVVAMAPASAQTAERMASPAAAAALPPEVIDTVKNALKRISASADTNAVMIEAVAVHDSDIVRAMLLQNGASAALLSSTPIDAAGSSKGPRKLNSHTIYFDMIPSPPNVPTPAGLVYLHGYGWVEWNDFESSWSWWW